MFLKGLEKSLDRFWVSTKICSNDIRPEYFKNVTKKNIARNYEVIDKKFNLKLFVLWLWTNLQRPRKNMKAYKLIKLINKFTKTFFYFSKAWKNKYFTSNEYLNTYKVLFAKTLTFQIKQVGFAKFKKSHALWTRVFRVAEHEYDAKIALSRRNFCKNNNST